MTGLSTSAVSTLVADLIEAEVLVELGTKASRAGGRPAVALGLAPRAGSLVGIHLGHADLRVVLTSLDGTVLMQQRHFLDVDHEPAASLDQLARSTADLLATGDVDRARVLAVGVAVSAPVVDSRMLASPPMLLDWGVSTSPAFWVSGPGSRSASGTTRRSGRSPSGASAPEPLSTPSCKTGARRAGRRSDHARQRSLRARA